MARKFRFANFACREIFLQFREFSRNTKSKFERNFRYSSTVNLFYENVGEIILGILRKCIISFSRKFRGTRNKKNCTTFSWYFPTKFRDKSTNIYCQAIFNLFCVNFREIIFNFREILSFYFREIQNNFIKISCFAKFWKGRLVATIICCLWM